MIKPKLLLVVIFLVTLTTAYTQEICNNGVDDDGDGFIDCFDSDCASSSDCDGFYIGNDASCEAVPSEFPRFSLTLDFASPNKTANHLGRIAIGDLDRDGIPEIVSQNRYTDELFILNGNDGSIKYSTTVSGGTIPEWRLAIGNIDNDDCAEIFTVLYEWDSRNRRANYHVASFDCQLNELWRTERLAYDPIHLSLADFDGDGQIELYYKNEIRDAKTGTRIVSGTGNWNSINGGPVAVDMDGDNKLELVSGLTIYNVNLGSRTTDAGSLTVKASRSEYGIKRPENSTSIADYNQDGFLDVIATGKDNNGVTTVFFWDVQNNVLRTYADPIPYVEENNLNCAAASGTDVYAKGWVRGTGRLNIGDLDGNGQLNVSFVSGRFLYALDENFDLLWRVDVNEETSGHTGCTLFDFNGDGKTEVVYRDEQWLYIINGTDGSVFTQVRCISRTNVEYPIVADVDADGSTELCVVCGYDDVDAWDNFCSLGYAENSHVRVYKSNGEPWVPARRLWNQHGYFNVNVNDDLSIPATQQKHHLVWSEGTCTVGPNRPLNNFLNQSPFLNSEGCPTYASPDLDFVDNSLTIDQPNCPELDFTVSFQLTNLGDVKITGDVPISFYNGDPFQAGATKLATIPVSLDHFKVGDVLSVNNITITGPGSPFTLYIVLNDGGTTVPTPITMPNTNFLECEYDNNVLQGLVDPIPFALSTETTNNITCSANTTPANGSARAYRLIGGSEVTTDYIFNWFDGTSASGTPDFQGAIYSGLTAGTYTVFATHKSALCNSDTVQVVIENDDTQGPEANVVLEIPYTNCKNPNGKLRVDVDGGEPTGKYTYEWYVGNIAGVGQIISKSHIAADLNPNTYSVLVTEKATGCITVATGTVPDESVTPVVTANATDITCSDTNSGVVNANVGGATNGYTFRWYRGNNVKPAADYTGSTVNNLAQGNYTVVATNNSTQCPSDPVTVTINKTVPPTVAATKGADNTSCDNTLPNGTASATANGGTSGFTFEWFTGQNTLPANSRGTGSSISGLPGGTYTVRATDNNTGCSATAQVTILNNIVVPTLTLNKTDATTCVPLNGSITASVSTGNLSDYTFFWYDGSNIKASPDYAETGNVLSGLGAGTYTVEAFNNTTNCLADSRTVTLSAPTLDIQLTSMTEPFDCDISNISGQIAVEITPNTENYTVHWYADNVDPGTGTPFFTDNGVTTSTSPGISAGNYTIVAVGETTGCEVQEVVYLPQVDGERLNLTTTVSHSYCDTDNGSITVNLTPATGFGKSDYELEIYQGTTTSGPLFRPSQNAGTSELFDLLPAGIYTVTAVPVSAPDVCPAPKVVVEVEFEAVDPNVTATTVDANVNCENATPTGQIEIEIRRDNTVRPASEFTVQWYEGQDISTPLSTGVVSGVNNEIVSELPAGYYTVVVEDATTYQGCNTQRTFRILENTPIIDIPTAGLSIDHVTSCVPGNNGSSVTITDIMENGVSVGTVDYEFDWFDASNNQIAGNTNVQTNLTAGTYYVIARKANSHMCETTRLEFEIEDHTIGDPFFELVAGNNELECFKPDNVNTMGRLLLTDDPNLTYTWYAGNGVGAPGNEVHVGRELTGAAAGDYTVLVQNNTTLCTASEVYTLIREEGIIPITASASPLTNCDVEDGSVFATVTNAFSNEYNYNWSIGNSVSSPAAFTGKDGTGLLDGDYTVQAVDQSNANCVSAPVTVTIDDGRIMPNLAVEQKSPLTVCDLSRADGSAIATVDGGFIGYTFNWYEGTTATGTPVYTGSEFFGMQAMTYTVTATDNVSECMSTQQITIEEDIPGMGDPTIEILSHVTSCITDNGALSVSVNGNTSDYIFHWYNGQQVKATSDFIGEIYDNRAAGFYTVTATSRITGCVSGPATAEILEDPRFPEFEFVVGNANCGQNNGYVRLILTNNVEVETIEWTGNGVTVTGPNLTEVTAGTYTVTVTTALGCSVTEDVEIKTEVNPFNGISRNGDASNDIFKIDCIENYPENIVKIFNRAGTQVFEAEGYDNATKYFDGVSNKGISVMGTGLPDGTYFYIIDKRDGSKPLAGYLEIVN
ncbi:hypothetical protein C900_01219 [Fulvivirga imtechensis AK7]|uniref:Uncharacterized protein n=1 Tax=Fulvivirga imtechensis AK7 TaxID=1237149 RepID=L8JUS3_9BACT|nr:gliding motility-associated C-terminal domain-containing protein [Fulvivirga imtechensis]ELR72545.1 hypothetical protein C900_01219 [Fulvivirga imtechensis AK7]